MNRQKVMESILAITIGFLVIFLFTHLRIFLYLSLLIGITGLFIPFLARLIAHAWSWIGIIMGNIVSRIALSLVFLFIILQALLYRLLKQKGPLDKQGNESFYQTRNHIYKPSDMEKLW